MRRSLLRVIYQICSSWRYNFDISAVVTHLLVQYVFILANSEFLGVHGAVYNAIHHTSQKR